MRTCELGNSGLVSSVLGFGCSAIMGRTGRKESVRALATAWDAGITFYDTARSYGYGESEAVLGEFLRPRRHQAIISTKFGILASRQTLLKRAAKPVARSLLSLLPSARAALRRRAAAEFTSNQFNVTILEQSLNESLRKLQTDYIDLLFLHEASADVLGNDDLMRALEKLIEAGKVRVAGISSKPVTINAALGEQPRPLQAAQFPCNILDFSATATAAAVRNARWVGIANHPFGGIAGVQHSRAFLRELAKDAIPELRQKLSDVNDAVLSDAVLNLILNTPGIHVVIPAMMQPAHIRDNVNSISQSRFSSSELDWLRASIAPRLSLT